MLIKRLNNIIAQRISESGMPYFIFGLFGLLNYPLSFFYWHLYNPLYYENLVLRLTATFLCLILLCKKYWHYELQKFFPLFWYFTLLYSIPFFGTFMVLKNHVSTAWLMNMLLGIFLFVLLVDWASFVVMLLIGTTLGLLFYMILGGTVKSIHISNWYTAAYMYIFALVIGGLFSRKNLQNKKNRIQQEKLKTEIAENRDEYNKQITSTIAHELRTPLTTVKIYANHIRQYINYLINGYKSAEQCQLPIAKIDHDILNQIPENLDMMNLEIDAAFSFIEMLLMNVNQSDMVREMKDCSISHCIELALERYPFKGTEKSSVHFLRPNQDFQFIGNELLMIHVFFNLIKNALYHIAAKPQGPGEITIWIEENHIHFRDTGTGIPAKVLPRIFERFYSRTRHGTGIGLAYCKMVMEAFSGSIRCDSIEGEYTEFMMTLPRLK